MSDDVNGAELLPGCTMQCLRLKLLMSATVQCACVVLELV